MRVIIAGSRTYKNRDVLNWAIRHSGFDITTILSGCANGVDSMGECYAIENKIPLEFYKPDWAGEGKKAGYVRSCEMVKEADALIALWEDESKGTKFTIDYARKQYKAVFVVEIVAGFCRY